MIKPHLSAHPQATAGLQASLPSSLLRMAVGGVAMAVPIDDVREILEVGRLTPLPRTPDFVRGVMNLRGAVVPVIDLAARVGMAPISIGRRSCVVVVEAEPLVIEGDLAAGEAAGEAAGDALHGALVVGLMVDAVYEVFDVMADGIEPPPALGTRIAADFLLGMTRAHGDLIGVLALDRVLAQQELSALIASHKPH